MSPEQLQLSSVAIGGLIGIGGAVLAAWVNATLAERKALRERTERFHELRGKRYAIMTTSRGSPESSSSESAAQWLQPHSPKPHELSFMIGVLEKTSEQIEVAMADAEKWRRESDLAKIQIAALTDEKDRLVVERDRNGMASPSVQMVPPTGAP